MINRNGGQQSTVVSLLASGFSCPRFESQLPNYFYRINSYVAVLINNILLIIVDSEKPNYAFQTYTVLSSVVFWRDLQKGSYTR